MKTVKECTESIGEIMIYYGFEPIAFDDKQVEYMPRILEFIEYLHGYAKEFVSTESIR